MIFSVKVGMISRLHFLPKFFSAGGETVVAPD
jgi:hypothetical protein